MFTIKKKLYIAILCSTTATICSSHQQGDLGSTTLSQSTTIRLEDILADKSHELTKKNRPVFTTGITARTTNSNTTTVNISAPETMLFIIKNGGNVPLSRNIAKNFSLVGSKLNRHPTAEIFTMDFKSELIQPDSKDLEHLFDIVKNIETLTSENPFIIVQHPTYSLSEWDILISLAHYLQHKIVENYLASQIANRLKLVQERGIEVNRFRKVLNYITQKLRTTVKPGNLIDKLKQDQDYLRKQYNFARDPEINTQIREELSKIIFFPANSANEIILATSPKEKTMVKKEGNNISILYSVAEKTIKQPIPTRARLAAISPDEETIITTEYDNRIRFWNKSPQKNWLEKFFPVQSTITNATINKNIKWIGFSHDDATILIKFDDDSMNGWANPLKRITLEGLLIYA